MQKSEPQNQLYTILLSQYHEFNASVWENHGRGVVTGIRSGFGYSFLENVQIFAPLCTETQAEAHQLSTPNLSDPGHGQNQTHQLAPGWI